MSSFSCKHCNKNVIDGPYGYITGCEHYPLEKLEPHPRNKRKDFIRVLVEYARDENAVTKSVHRDILKGRLDRDDIS